MELIKNKKQWKKYKTLTELRLGTMPFTANIDEPAEYPCLCQGIISQTIGNGFKIFYVVIYKEDAENLLTTCIK